MCLVDPRLAREGEQEDSRVYLGARQFVWVLEILSSYLNPYWDCLGRVFPLHSYNMRTSLIQNPGLPTIDTCFDLTFTLAITVKYLMTINKGLRGEVKLS